MDEVQFEDSTKEFGAPPTTETTTDWTGKLVLWGFAANRDQAQYIMVGILALVIILTIIVYFFWL